MTKSTMGTKLPCKLEQKMHIVGGSKSGLPVCVAI